MKQGIWYYLNNRDVGNDDDDDDDDKMRLYFYIEYQNACYMIKIRADWNFADTINLLEGKG